MKRSIVIVVFIALRYYWSGYSKFSSPTCSLIFSLVVLVYLLVVLVYPLVVFVFPLAVLLCLFARLLVVPVSLLVVSICPFVILILPFGYPFVALVELSVGLFISDQSLTIKVMIDYRFSIIIINDHFQWQFFNDNFYIAFLSE